MFSSAELVFLAILTVAVVASGLVLSRLAKASDEAVSLATKTQDPKPADPHTTARRNHNGRKRRRTSR